MAFETYRWKGALEPKHDETSGTAFQQYQWKGAIEPTGAAAPAGARPQGPLGHPFKGIFGGPI